MREKKLNLDELEDVKFRIEKGAFRPRTLTCSKCNLRMKKAEIEISLEGGVSLRVLGFECPKCQKRHLGLEEARKLDKALIISRMIRNDSYKPIIACHNP